MKNYFKKCKNALENLSTSATTDQPSASSSSEHPSENSNCLWYVDDPSSEVKESEVCELEDVFERAQGLEEVVVEQLANVIDVKSGKAVDVDAGGDDFPSPPLTEVQAKVDGGNLENAETAGIEMSKVCIIFLSTTIKK